MRSIIILEHLRARAGWQRWQEKHVPLPLKILIFDLFITLWNAHHPAHKWIFFMTAQRLHYRNTFLTYDTNQMMKNIQHSESSDLTKKKVDASPIQISEEPVMEFLTSAIKPSLEPVWHIMRYNITSQQCTISVCYVTERAIKWAFVTNKSFSLLRPFFIALLSLSFLFSFWRRNIKISFTGHRLFWAYPSIDLFQHKKICLHSELV